MKRPFLLLASFLVLLLIALPLAATPTAAAADLIPVNDVCEEHTDTTTVLNSTTQSAWTQWISALSGARSVLIGGSPYTIATRSTRYLFNGSANAKAFDYILEQVSGWGYLGEHIEIMPYTMPAYLGGYTAENLILTIPGTTYPDQEVILSAHLDDTSQSPATLAPGAEDNGSGAALLLEAARLLRHYSFARTLKLIWFTGEEQGLVGSSYYVDYRDISGVIGVVNLDMFGYDHDNDRCFELHVGDLAASDAVGQCFVHSIAAYGMNLKVDYLGPGLGEGYSDHASFWRHGIGAVEILENYSNQFLPGGCVGVDRNPYYHTINDTVLAMNMPVGFDIARAGLATVMDLAVPQGSCFTSSPQVSLALHQDGVTITWEAVPGASSYRIYRADNSCAGVFNLLQQGVSATSWTDATVENGHAYAYQVEAVALDGMCVSERSDCRVIVVDPEACTTAPILEVPAASYQAVSLHWNTLVSATSYQVERGQNPGGAWEQVAEVNQPAWIDSPVASGQSFNYRVKAQIQNGICQTPASNEQQVTIPYQVFLSVVAK
jgi:hypothetical protein